MLSAAERQLRARIGAFRLHAKHDSTVITKAARDAFLGRFEREVDPENRLSPEERARRARHARQAYFLSLAFKSTRARRNPKAGQRGRAGAVALIRVNGHDRAEA